MGARWYWFALCENGHVYSNYSGGPDDCYFCEAPMMTSIDCQHRTGEECDCEKLLRRVWDDNYSKDKDL